jgi:DNA polymerase I-like protein with 3'-5' exonuclease and polymerase domains
VPLEQGKAIYYKLERDYPNLTAYTKRLNKQDYVVLDSGRIVPLWDKYYVDANGVHVDRRKESRNALNYATQGNQRDLLWLAVKRHIEHGWMWALVMFMHDELVAMVPEEMAEEYARFQKWSMTMDYHGMPIECETDGIDTPGPFRQTWMPQPDEFDLRDLEVMDDDDAA